MNCMSQLLTIGEGDFFVSCLLHLSPEDLKACRLVNKTWNKVIKERVWGNKRARKRLEEKLLNRWKTTNPEAVQLGTVPRGVQAIFCNNSHVFCGMYGGEVKVYSLADGQWVRDLESREEGLEVWGIRGGETIVAAQLGTRVVTIWSSKEEMGRLHSFDACNHEGMEGGRVRNIKVTRNKVIILLKDNRTLSTRHWFHQLVVLQEGEHNWENKFLETFSTPRLGKLALHKDCWGVAGDDESRPRHSDNLKIKLWKDELFSQDIELPGVSSYGVRDVVLESPFLVVGGDGWIDGRATFWIKVFQLAADKLMEDLNSAAPLIKTLQFPGFYLSELICTGLVLGCVLKPGDNGERSLVLFEKTALLEASTLPEQTSRNRVHLGATNNDLVDMNTTSLVFIQKSESESSPGRDGQEQNYLCKKDFWMSGNTDG